ncbi:hypothetical protein QQP08_009343 [Theobroma cacao]|nr:hypothetical protein QQP08_009343 [Theobroma cacao]
MVASSGAAKSAKTNNRKQTGSIAKITYFKKRANEAPAKRRVKQVVGERSRANEEMMFEELGNMEVELNETGPMFPQMQAGNQMMGDEATRMRNEIHELRGALQILAADVERMKQIPREWNIDGRNFTSFDEAQTWILSQTYGQGSGTNDTNMTASAAAGPLFASHVLPNNAPDNNPFSHDPAPAAGNKAGFPTASAVGSFFAAYPELDSVFDVLENLDFNDPFTDHDLAAINQSSHDLPVMFDALNKHDTVSNLSTYLTREMQAMVLSTFGKEANNELMDLGIQSSRSDIQYADEFRQDFIAKLDDKEKSRVDFLDFKGLPEELEKCGRFRLPPSLVPIDESLNKAYGDITAESNQSKPVIRESYILFCFVIKEMNELQLEQVNLDKIILWRNAINSGLSIGFKGNFAIEHLKKIARAYFGYRELKSLEERISELKAKLYDLEKKRNSIIERQSSEMHQECLRDQEYFQGKPLSTGLFLS